MTGTDISRDPEKRFFAIVRTSRHKRAITNSVGFQMDFGSEPSTRTAERLTFLPPLAPAADTWARMTVLSNIAIR